MLNIAIMGSGKGSNCQSLIDAIEKNELDANIVCVLSDVENAYILERAANHGIPSQYIDHAPFKTKLDGTAEEKVIETLTSYQTDLIVLAGYMRIVKSGLLRTFKGRIVNIHPSLLPAFPGLASWKQALDYGVKVAGCTVHFVDQGMDTGPIILQKTVPVLDDDTPESLHARIQEQEHLAYPEAIKLITERKVAISGRKVAIQQL